MKLWTLQSREFLSCNRSARIYADWEKSPQNWRGWYRWMCLEWESRVKSRMTAAPVWCWHSCNGIAESEPTVGTFAMLMGDWDYFATSMVGIQLVAPDNLVLLSSYSRWNDAIDDAIARKLNHIQRTQYGDMFEHPLMKHEVDDIQAVIPYIDSTWISDVRLLPPGTSTQIDWDMPFSEFPPLPEPWESIVWE